MTSKENSNFPQTRISLIARVRDVDGSIRKKALEEFITNYRPALLNYLVRCKHAKQDEAEDVVQDFILNKIINGNLLELAGIKGRFRGLLRTCLKNYFIDIKRKRNRDTIGQWVELQQVDQSEDPVADPLDQVWAEAIFREALLIMKRESDYWGLFLDRVLTQPPIPYSEIVTKYDMEDPAKASNALMTAKRQFNRIIEGLIAKQSYLTDDLVDEDISQEVEYLRSQLTDSKVLGQLIESVSQDSDETGSKQSSLHHSIFGERILIIDEGAEANWSKAETKSILTHLLSQPVRELLNSSEPDSLTLQQLIESATQGNEDSISQLHPLKDLFNQNAKKRTGPLPYSVNVTMTFVLIATYLVSGGRPDQITTINIDALRNRLGHFLDKDWIPATIADLCQQAIASIAN